MSIQFCDGLGQFGHELGDLDALGTDLLAGTAGHAVGGLAHGVYVLQAVEGPDAVGLVPVVDLQHGGNVDFGGTAVAAVAAAGAGHADLPAEGGGGLKEQPLLVVGQRPVLGHGGEVVVELVQIGHAAEADLDAGEALEPSEGPGGDGPVGMGGLEHGLGLGGELGQTAPADGFHDHHRDTPGGNGLILGLGGAVDPVEVIELDLDEVPLALVEHFVEGLQAGVGGEAQIADLALRLVLAEVVYAAAGEIFFDIAVAHGMEEVEVQIIGAELFALLREDGLVVGVGVVAELGGQAVAAAVIGREGLPQEGLRAAAVVAVGGVEVVDALGQSLVDDLLGAVIVDGRVGLIVHSRQAHIAHAQPGEGDGLERLINHAGETSCRYTAQL